MNIEDFYKHAYLFLITFPIVLVINNWWYAVFINNEAKKRILKNKFLWILGALVLGQLILIIYNAKTQRLQTALTGSMTGAFAGEKLQKTSPKKRIILILFFVVWLILSIISIFGSKNGLVSLLNDRNTVENILFAIFIPILMIVYILLTPKDKNKLNILDKPIFSGMEQTPEGLIDQSLTRYKKTTKILIWITILIWLFFFAFFIYAGLIIK